MNSLNPQQIRHNIALLHSLDKEKKPIDYVQEDLVCLKFSIKKLETDTSELKKLTRKCIELIEKKDQVEVVEKPSNINPPKGWFY